MPLLRLDRFRAFLPLRWLTRAIPALSLACLAAILLAAPTQAQGWQLTYTATGTETTTPFDPAPPSGQTFSDSATGTNSVGNTKTWSSGFDLPGGTTTNMSVTVTVNGKWTGSDPAPPSVMVIETVWLDQDGVNGDGSLATGTFDDGFGDKSYVIPTANGPDEVCTTPDGTPIQHQTIKSGGSFTLTHTFKVGSSAAAYMHNGADATTRFDGYSATIHAQPYNFHKVPGAGHIYPDGRLEFVYDWLSTTGNKDNLTSCFWHEYTTYQGTVGTASNPNKYYPPNPPFNFIPNVSWLNNPFVNPGVGNKGGPMAGTYRITDDQNVPPLVDPTLYAYGTFTATQVFQFDDTATGETNVQIPGPDSGPFSIAREFKLYDLHDYKYTVTKDTKTSFVLKPF